MEGYCRSRLGQKDFKRMRDHAAVDVNVHGCTKDALALLAATRKYVAHLTKQHVPAEEIVAALPDSTRRGHALMQACLLRDIGFGKLQAQNILKRHYANWPIPTL
jgi:hypothetical protein